MTQIDAHTGEGRKFGDIRSRRTMTQALPVDDFMAELTAMQKEICHTKNLVWERVADGTLHLDYLKRLAMEYHVRGRYYTTEFGTLASLAPDGDAISLSHTEHFEHWLQNLADETGYTGDKNHVDMKVTWAHQLGITDEELDSYRPIPETIGAVFTTMYYMRRSYEEGLAAFGWAGERFAAGTGYAKMMYEGLRDHYGMEVENFAVHAYAEVDHGDAADYLLRQMVLTGDQQRRVRRAVENVFLCREARTVALNRWLDEPGALR